VCGSCWAEAATGALSDRFTIATGGKLRVALAPQALLNFNQFLTGGTCNGGDHLKAYEFAHNHGIADDTCQVFVGLDAAHGFEVNDYTDADDIRSHQCYMCEWNGLCGFVPKSVHDVYGADEYGNVLGVDEMKAEIYARGPIACSINSEANAFNYYQGGVIKCDSALDTACKSPFTDHVIVIAGWGVEEATGTPYWVGRNSYGTRWGEGAGGGWFRLELGTDVLNLESNTCSFAVPAQADVDRALKQFSSAAGY
jgi:cathepsin X